MPILVGPGGEDPRDRREATASTSATRAIVDAPHSHASAAKAVELVRKGEAELLMKGSLHTDELLGAVVARETGLRTGRRISHVFIMDVPTYHKVLIVTDAAINIAPTLEDKVDICQNAIDLAISLGVDEAEGRDPRGGRDGQLEDAGDASTRPRCARWPSAGRSRAACSTARWRSTTPSARRRRGSRASRRRSPAIPTSCSCPTSRPATSSPSSSRFLANADSAGLVLGARVPIILTSRADSVRSRIASCARRDAGGACAAPGAAGDGVADRPWTTTRSSSTPARRA